MSIIPVYFGRCILLTIFGVAILSGCSFFNLKVNLDEIDQLMDLKGEVKSLEDGSSVIIAVIRRDTSVPTLVNYRVLSGGGPFHFKVEPGDYKLFAFEDRNTDLKYQITEPATRSTLYSGKASESFDSIALQLTAESDPELLGAVAEFKKTGKRSLPSYKESLGKIVSLDDDAFKPENSKAGMWEPLKFVKKVPFGVFFLEKYNPKKTPVLFVHGIDGSPRNFEEIVANLDRSRYQAWVAFYPSGFRLKAISHFFNSALNEIHAKHRFSEMFVVAHSMGGLVSRGFILENSKRKGGSFVTRFITISTPWGGHSAAKAGVKNAPVVMPVWNDMSPGSEFLSEIFSKDLSMPHFLLFSYRGGASLLQENNDGVVSLESQLRYEAQIPASLVRGFDADHTGILRDSSAIKTVHDLLEYTDLSPDSWTPG